MWFNTFTKVLYYFTKREYCYYGCIGKNRRITQTKRLDDVQIGQRSGTYAVHTDKYVHTGNKSVDRYTIGNLRGTRCEHVGVFQRCTRAIRRGNSPTCNVPQTHSRTKASRTNNSRRLGKVVFVLFTFQKKHNINHNQILNCIPSHKSTVFFIQK